MVIIIYTTVLIAIFNHIVFALVYNYAL